MGKTCWIWEKSWILLFYSSKAASTLPQAECFWELVWQNRVARV